MPFTIKNAGVWTPEAQKGDVSIKDAGTWKTANQMYLRDQGVWVPMWSEIPLVRYGYGPFAANTLDQAAGFATAEAFLNNYVATDFPDNDDGHTITADTSGETANSTYLYLMWPAELGDITIQNESFGAPEEWWGQGETYAGEIWNFVSDPGRVTVNLDDGTGARDWYVRRNDTVGGYDLVTTLYSFAFSLN